MLDGTFYLLKMVSDDAGFGSDIVLKREANVIKTIRSLAESDPTLAVILSLTLADALKVTTSHDEESGSRFSSKGSQCLEQVPELIHSSRIETTSRRISNETSYVKGFKSKGPELSPKTSVFQRRRKWQRLLQRNSEDKGGRRLFPNSRIREANAYTQSVASTTLDSGSDKSPLRDEKQLTPKWQADPSYARSFGVAIQDSKEAEPETESDQHEARTITASQVLDSIRQLRSAIQSSPDLAQVLMESKIFATKEAGTFVDKTQLNDPGSNPETQAHSTERSRMAPEQGHGARNESSIEVGGCGSASSTNVDDRSQAAWPNLVREQNTLDENKHGESHSAKHEGDVGGSLETAGFDADKLSCNIAETVSRSSESRLSQPIASDEESNFCRKGPIVTSSPLCDRGSHDPIGAGRIDNGSLHENSLLGPTGLSVKSDIGDSPSLENRNAIDSTNTGYPRSPRSYIIPGFQSELTVNYALRKAKSEVPDRFSRPSHYNATAVDTPDSLNELEASGSEDIVDPYITADLAKIIANRPHGAQDAETGFPRSRSDNRSSLLKSPAPYTLRKAKSELVGTGRRVTFSNVISVLNCESSGLQIEHEIEPCNPSSSLNEKKRVTKKKKRSRGKKKKHQCQRARFPNLMNELMIQDDPISILFSTNSMESSDDDWPTWLCREKNPKDILSRQGSGLSIRSSCDHDTLEEDIWSVDDRTPDQDEFDCEKDEDREGPGVVGLLSPIDETVQHAAANYPGETVAFIERHEEHVEARRRAGSYQPEAAGVKDAEESDLDQSEDASAGNDSARASECDQTELMVATSSEESDIDESHVNESCVARTFDSDQLALPMTTTTEDFDSKDSEVDGSGTEHAQCTGHEDSNMSDVAGHRGGSLQTVERDGANDLHFAVDEASGCSAESSEYEEATLQPVERATEDVHENTAIEIHLKTLSNELSAYCEPKRKEVQKISHQDESGASPTTRTGTRAGVVSFFRRILSRKENGRANKLATEKVACEKITSPTLCSDRSEQLLEVSNTVNASNEVQEISNPPGYTQQETIQVESAGDDLEPSTGGVSKVSNPLKLSNESASSKFLAKLVRQRHRFISDDLLEAPVTDFRVMSLLEDLASDDESIDGNLSSEKKANCFPMEFFCFNS